MGGTSWVETDDLVGRKLLRLSEGLSYPTTSPNGKRGIFRALSNQASFLLQYQRQ